MFETFIGYANTPRLFKIALFTQFKYFKFFKTFAHDFKFESLRCKFPHKSRNVILPLINLFIYKTRLVTKYLEIHISGSLARINLNALNSSTYTH